MASGPVADPPAPAAGSGDGPQVTIISEWRTILKRSAAVWVQFAQLLLGFLTFVDPANMLGIWNMMPQAFTARIPFVFVQGVGAVLFGLALLTILLRLIKQPVMEQKVEEHKQAKAEEVARAN